MSIHFDFSSKLIQVAVLHSSACSQVFAATWTLRSILALTFTSIAVGGGMLTTLGTAGAITRFGEVNVQNTKSLRNVIESGRDGDVRAVQLAKQFYDSCMNTEVLDAMGSQPLVQLVRSMGGWRLISILNSEF